MKARVKRFGFIIGIGALLYRIISFVILADDIFTFWKTGVVFYFALYLTSFFTIKSSVSDDNKSKKLSLIMLAVSAGLLYIDYLSFLGQDPSLNGIHPVRSGISPIADVLNIIANAFILIECRINSRTVGVPSVYDSEFEAFKAEGIGFVNIIAAFAIAIFLMFVFQKMNIYTLRNNAILNETIHLMQNTYEERIGDGNRRDKQASLYWAGDPDKEIYIANLYWNYKIVKAYVEVLPDNSISLIKENFQSVKYSYYLEEEIAKEFGHNRFVVEYEQWDDDTHYAYDDYVDYFSRIPAGDKVNIIYSIDEKGSVIDKTTIESIINMLPGYMEGNFIIKLDQNPGYISADDIITINIPYSQNQSYFSSASVEGNYQSSNAVETILGFGEEYLYSQIKNAIVETEGSGGFPDDIVIDHSHISASIPVKEFIYEKSNSAYFTHVRDCFIVYSDDEPIGVCYLKFSDKTYKYVLDTCLAECIRELGITEFCLIHDTEYVYLYDGSAFYRLYPETEQLVGGFGSADGPMDQDLSTDEIEFDREVDYDNIELTDITEYYSIGTF